MSEKGEKAVQQMLDKTAGSKETLQQPQSQLTKTPSAVTDYDTDAESHSVKNDVRFVLGGQLNPAILTSILSYLFFFVNLAVWQLALSIRP